MAETSGDASVDTPPTGIDEHAPVVGASEIEIAAPRDTVWDVLTTFERWPTWNPDVKSVSMQGSVAPGSVFRWKAGPGTVTSTIRRVERPRLIGWTGKSLGVNAIHFWHLEPRDDMTLVRTEESFDGIVARLLRGSLQKTLERTLSDALRYLKAEAEQRTQAACRVVHARLLRDTRSRGAAGGGPSLRVRDGATACGRPARQG
jgi:uncharacterized protein YndB with AHSA1/START domain